MNNTVTDVIVIGAGHAGLCVSYYLTRNGIRHIVFEQGRVGETWRSQRWDSFKLNSANKLNLLPGQLGYFDDPDAFSFANEFALSLETYMKQLNLPVKEHCNVLEVKKDETQTIFHVTISEEGTESTYLSRQIVIASGGQNKIRIPSFAKNVSPRVLQLHTCYYKNPGQLPNGNVLVVGSAQSGTQVADDLVRANRNVFLSTGMAGRFPRRYRGKDIFDWLFGMGFYDVLTDDITDPAILTMKPPQVSGAGERGKTTSLQSLARQGVKIFGRAANADLETMFFQPDAAAHVKYADEFSLTIKRLIDEYIKENNLPDPLPELDPDDIPDEHASCASVITQLNLDDNNINSIIWTTGFSGDFNYLKLPVLSEQKTPKHHNGLSAVEGLYFIGLPWLRKRKSAVIPGISDDAEYIVNQIVRNTHL
ncbi:flavin-containing monooxygenase [Spirosoma luteum]|uniref:flavin-containing monooxygenase n=1 Tax=Spirosoma luteum TaxID=431553 RepID=UPI000362C413|nr:NAD(P)/FAD-dependent oxidoreductase [Spirosoma luteum]